MGRFTWICSALLVYSVFKCGSLYLNLLGPIFKYGPFYLNLSSPIFYYGPCYSKMVGPFFYIRFLNMGRFIWVCSAQFVYAALKCGPNYLNMLGPIFKYGPFYLNLFGPISIVCFKHGPFYLSSFGIVCIFCFQICAVLLNFVRPSLYIRFLIMVHVAWIRSAVLWNMGRFT